MQPAPWDNRSFGVVRHHARMLAALGTPLPRGGRVLDFGCGEGTHVYDYREEGYDAFGFEIAPIAKLRSPEDARFFAFAGAATPGAQDYRVDKATFRIPFESDSFDFVFSVETFEHVTEYDAAFAEIARVLKPGGTAIHTFPARYRLIEPHTKVPLGGVIQGYAWYLLWALLGVRNEFQRGVGPFARARQNADFMKKCVNYLTTGEILRHAAAHFKEADLVPHLWLLANDGYGCAGALCMLVRPYRALYSKMGDVVLYVRKC